jgi:hypothetical protein
MPNVEATLYRRTATHDTANHGADETRNQDEPPTPPVYSVFSPDYEVFLDLITVFRTLFSPFSSFTYLPAIAPIAESCNRSFTEI